LNIARFIGGPDKSTTIVGIGVGLAAQAAGMGGGAGDTRFPNSESRGENATGVTCAGAALAESGFGSPPCRRVGSAIFAFGTCACIGGDRGRGTGADAFIADDPSLDMISSWSSGSPDAQ